MFQVLSSRTAAPANVKIDFKDIRPVHLTEDLYLDQIDLKKISITEDDYKLSMSEGGSASVSRCADCSINAVHPTLDYSGSVRDQFEVLKNNAIKFISTLDRRNLRVALSFFTGEASLYSIGGDGHYFETGRLISLLEVLPVLIL
ncbi:MAG: hypothetical protein NDI69_00015 [Bacteriovoracaceae bacterium]|nr:hypothetical protein [Bacteriovoracaceae bacterium]